MHMNFLKADRLGLAGTVYNRIVQVLIYVTVVLLPLWYLPVTSGILEYNKQMLLLVVASLGLLIWLLGVVVSGTLSVRTSLVDKGVMAVLIATAAATVLSVTHAKSIFGLSNSLSSSLMSVMALSIFYFLAVNTPNDRGRMLRSVLSVSLLLTLVVGLFQMFGWYVLPGTFTYAPAFNTVGSINTLGLVAAIGLALFAKSGMRGGRGNMTIAIAGTVCSILVLGIINWWALWAVALAGMLTMIAFDSLNATQLAEDYGGRRRGRFALSRFVVPMSVIVIGAFLLLVKFNPVSVRANFPTEVAPSYKLSWQVTKSVLSQKLLLGFGPENFSLAFDRFGASHLATTELSNFKFFDGIGEVFSLAVHEGAIGLLALALLLWCLVQVIVRFSASLSGSLARGESVAFALETSGTLAAAVTAGVAMFFYPFTMSLFFIWYVLLALVGLSIADQKPTAIDIEDRPTYSLTASLGFMLGLILVLTGIYFSAMRYMADVRYAHAVTQKTPQNVLDGLTSALSFNGASDQYLRSASQAELSFVRQELNAPASNDPQRPARIQNMITMAVQMAQRATQVAPEESLNWENLGQVYRSLSGLVNDVERLAQEAFTRASDLRPGDPTFDQETGAMWMARADSLRQARLNTQADEALSRAEQSFKAALEKSPVYGLAMYNLGAVYDRQGKTDQAIKQLEKVVPYNPNESTLLFELGLLYVRVGRRDDAFAAMNQAILVNPQYANARWYVALMLEERGDITGALANLAEIKKNNPSNTVLDQKIAQLQAGQRSIPPGKVIDTKPLQ